jgi:hypothetical protein
MESMHQPVAQARAEGLVIQELPDEVLVYDLDRHRAHSLNRTAALVWRHCNGRTTVDQMAALLEHELAAPVGEEAIWIALQRLARAHLLSERAPVLSRTTGSSRRALLRGLAMMGGLAVITSIAAPKAHAAASLGAPCNKNKDCFSNHCCNCVDGSGGCVSDCGTGAGSRCEVFCTGHGGRAQCN